MVAEREHELHLPIFVAQSPQDQVQTPELLKFFHLTLFGAQSAGFHSSAQDTLQQACKPSLGLPTWRARYRRISEGIPHCASFPSPRARQTEQTILADPHGHTILPERV
jgi:hypothetical protein